MDRKEIDTKKMELQKLCSRKIYAEAEALTLGAEVEIAQWDDVSKMMDLALDWINATEEEILKLPDAREWIDLDNYISKLTDAKEIREEEIRLLEELRLLPDYRQQHRDLILRMFKYLKAARQSHKKNDPIQTIRLFPQIERCYGITLLVLKKIQRVESGGKGGSASKHKVWADIVGNKLNDEHPGKKKEDAWLMIPESHALWRCIETDDDEQYEVYRDGDDLIAVNKNTEKITAIKKETFFSNYFFKKST